MIRKISIFSSQVLLVDKDEDTRIELQEGLLVSFRIFSMGRMIVAVSLDVNVPKATLPYSIVLSAYQIL